MNAISEYQFIMRHTVSFLFASHTRNGRASQPGHPESHHRATVSPSIQSQQIKSVNKRDKIIKKKLKSYPAAMRTIPEPYGKIYKQTKSRMKKKKTEKRMCKTNNRTATQSVTKATHGKRRDRPRRLAAERNARNEKKSKPAKLNHIQHNSQTKFRLIQF